jgi:haloalkane dehalogenase
MDILRTSDDRFTDLPGYDFTPNYVEIDGLRVHYVDEGPRDGRIVLLLHGEPSWSFLYRHVVGPLVAAGHRAVAPDLVGFGRSDKPSDIAAHTYQAHVDWTRQVIEALDLRDITLVCQDWGGLIGLRLAAEHGDRFAAVVAANTGLMTGDFDMPEIWWRFRSFVETADELPVSFLVDAGCTTDLAPDVRAAYDAPFPDESYKAGPRAMPQLVPTSPDDPAAPACRAAWEQLTRWDKPFLTAFSDSDPITAPMGPILRKVVPGAQGRDHPTIAGAGHFLQEDAGAELGQVVADFLAQV